MNTDPTQTNAPDWKPPPAAHTAEECQSLMQRAHGFYQLGLYADAAAELEEIRPPEAWRAPVANVRCLTAYAMGDMPRVVALGNEYRHTAGLPENFYSVLGIALHNCGRWQEAVDAEKMRMCQYGETPSGHYGIACFYGKALQIEPALMHLFKALRGCPDYRIKALVDSDLRPFWTRLPFVPLTPPMKEVLYSPVFCGLRRTKLTAAVTLEFDAAERATLPAGFGPWLEFDQVSYLLELSPSAPKHIRRRFMEWGLNRARATLRLVRRAMQRVMPPQPSPEQRAGHLNPSPVPLPGYSLSERDLRRAYDTLLLLRDSSTDPELRQEYHDELCNLTHSRLIESMSLDCENTENEPQP